MKAYQISLSADKEIPRFKVFSAKEVEVDLRTIITYGVHPASLTINPHSRDTSNLADRIIKELNEESMMISELRQLGYCTDISVPKHSYYYNETPLRITFSNIADCVYFVDDLHYVELLQIAKEQLQKKWCNDLAKKLLMATGGAFNDIRQFLKSKDKKLKLSSYGDLDNYDLGQILSLEDFAHFEKTLISHGLPRTNFRSSRFAEMITKSDNKSLLSFVPSINHFQIQWCESSSGAYSQYPNIVYNCQVNAEQIRFVPNLDIRPETREQAKQIAQTWGKAFSGRYCFTVCISDVEKMLDEEVCQIQFPKLNYIGETVPDESTAQLVEKHIERNFIGKHIAANLPNDAFKEILRVHNIPMTGRKEDLLEKLYDLLANLYEEKEPLYARYFAKNRFIRIKTSTATYSKHFDVDEESLVNNTLLTMYVLKHLRGNTILEASHENNTFELRDLAKSLLNNEVTVNGHFLKVE